MQIRPARLPEEALTISQIFAESWQTAYRGIIAEDYLQSLRGDEWVAGLNDSKRTILVLEDAGSLLGVVTFGGGRDSAWHDRGELMSIYLRPAAMHHGYGAALLDQAETSLAQHGYHTIYLWVLAENVRSRHFYEKQGYHQTEDVKPLAIRGKTLQTLRYLKVL